jgi:hypothetical protein
MPNFSAIRTNSCQQSLYCCVMYALLTSKLRPTLFQTASLLNQCSLFWIANCLIVKVRTIGYLYFPDVPDQRENVTLA